MGGGGGTDGAEMRMLASNRRGLGPIPDPDVTNKLTLLLFPCLSTRVFSTGCFLPCNKQKIKKGKSRDTGRENPLSTCPLLSMIWSFDVRLNKKFQFLHLPTVEVSITCNKVENP